MEHMTKPRKHLTDRSRVMMPVGATWVLVGYGILTNNIIVMAGAPHAMILGNLWGVVWIVTGLIGFVAAITRICKDAAIGILMVMPVIRATSYAIALTTAQLTDHHHHPDPDGTGQFLLCIIAAWLVWAIAKIDHPSPIHLALEEDAR